MKRLGRYELVGLIAAGGMAKVYLARVYGEGGFEREMAVKVMHDHLRDDPDFVMMFLDEARLAARLRHPNVVPTLDVQKTNEALFLVMEFIEGLSLSALLRQVREKVYRSLVDAGELEWDEAKGEIRQQPAFLGPTLASEVERLSEVVEAPKLDVKHKLKITAPIIPFILSYEGEVELRSGLNLEVAWQRLVTKVRSER